MKHIQTNNGALIVHPSDASVSILLIQQIIEFLRRWIVVEILGATRSQNQHRIYTIRRSQVVPLAQLSKLNPHV